MNIVFKCQYCKTSMQTSPDAVGLKCVCVGCGKQTSIQLQTDEETTPARVNSLAAKATTLSVACPTCSQKLDYQRSLIGTKGLCRRCHEVFLLPDEGGEVTIEQRSADSIAFECSSCQQLFEGNRSQVGKRGRCTNCKAVFTIEPLERKRDFEPAVVPTQEEKSPPASAQSSPPALSKTTSKRTRETQHRPAASPATSSRANRPASVPAEPLPTPATQEPVYDAITNWTTQGMDVYSAPVLPQYDTTQFSYSTPSFQARGGLNRLTFGSIIEHTFNNLFPALFYLYLPVLIAFGMNLALSGIMYAYGLYIQPSLISISQPVGIAVGITAIVLYIVAQIAVQIYIYPSFFQIANAAVRGREITTELLDSTGEVRWKLYGYILLQSLIMAMGFLPLMGIFVLASMVHVVLAFPIGMAAALVYVVCLNILLIGACAVVQRKNVFDSVKLSFQITSENFGPLLLLGIVETTALIPISITVVGLIFFVPQYVLIRSAAIYHLAVRR